MQLISSHCKALESLLGQDPAWAAGRRPLQQQQQQQQQHAVPQAVVAASSPTALSFSPLSARRLSDEVQGQRFRSPTCSDDGRLTQAYDMLRASACELLPPKELPSSRTSLELWGHAASQQQQQQQARPSHPRPPPPPRPPAHFPQHQLPSHAHVMASAPASGLLGLGPLPADDCDPPLLSHQTKVPQQTPANLLCSSNPPDATTSVQPPTAHLPQPPPTTARAPVGSLAWAVAAALKGATPTLESPGPVADMASSAPSHAGRLSSAAPAPASSASGPASSLVLMLLSLLNERDGHQAAVSTHDSSAAPAAAMPAPPAAYATVVKSAGGTSAAVTPAALHVLSAAAAAGSGGISGAIVATADGSAVGHGLSIAMLPVEPPRQLASSTSLPPPALLPPSPPPASRLHRGAYASPERQQLRLTDRSASFPASPPPPSQFLQRQQQRQQHLGSSPSPTLAPLPSPRVVTASAQRRELRGSGSHTTGAPPTPRGAVQAVPGPWPPASPKPSPKPSPRPSPKPSPFASPAPLPKASPFASPLPSLKGGAVRQPLKGQAALRTQPKGGAPQSRRPVLVAPASAPPRPGGRPRRMSPGSQDLTGFEELQQSSSSEIEDFLLDGVPLSPICDLRAKYSAAAAQQPTERQLGHSPSPKPLAMPPLDRLWSTQAQAAFAAEPSPDPAQPLVGYSAAVSGEMGAVSGGSDVPGSGKGNPAGMRDLLDVIEAWTKVAYVEVERLAKQRSAGGVGAAASLGGAASPEAGDLGREASGEGQGQGAGARLRESKSLEAGMGQGGAAMQQESAGSAGSGALGAKTASGATSADMPRLPEAVPSAAFARLVTQPAASAAQPATQLRMQAAASAGGPSTGTAARPLQVVSGAAGTGQLARHAQQQRPAPAVLPELLPASGQQHVAAVRRQWAEREAAARGPALAHAVHGTADAVEQQHVVMTGSGDQKGAAEKRGTVDSEEGGGWWGSVGGAVQQESAGKAARQQPPVAVSAVAVLAAAHSQGQGGAESLPSSAAPTLAGGPTEAPSSAATGIAAAAAPPSTTAPACASPAPAVSPSASAGSTGPSVGSTVACEISVRGSGELLHQPQPDARQAEADTAGKQRDQGQGPAAARDDSTAASADEPASGVQQGAAAEQQRRAGKGLPKHEDDSVFAFHQPPLPATAAPGVSDTGSSPTSSVSSAKLRPRAPRAPPSSPSEAPWHRLPPSSPASPASASKPKGPASSSTEQWRQRLGLALSHVNPRHASGVEGLGPRQRKLQGAEDRASRVVDDKTQRDAGEGWQRRGANEEGGKAGQVREGEKQGPLSLVGKATGCGDMGLQKGEASETSAGSRAESRSTRDSSCATQREGDKATAAAQAPEAAPASEGTVSAAAQAAVEQPQGRTDGHAGVPLLSGAAGGSMAHGVKLGVMEACTAWVPQEKEQREGEQETGGTGCSAAGDVPRRVAGVAGSGASVDVGGRAPDSVCAGAVSKEPSKGRLLRLLGWPFGRGRKSAVGGRDAAGVGGDEERPKGKGGLLGCARA